VRSARSGIRKDARRFQVSSIQSGKNAHKTVLREPDRRALIAPWVLGATPGFAWPRTIHLQRTPALLPVGGGFNFLWVRKATPEEIACVAVSRLSGRWSCARGVGQSEYQRWPVKWSLWNLSFQPRWPLPWVSRSPWALSIW